MSTKFIPTWKDREGNRLFFIAENHLFDDWNSAFKYQAADFIFYIPMGMTPAGVMEIDVDERGHASVKHVQCDGPMQSVVAVVEGPIMQKIEAAP